MHRHLRRGDLLDQGRSLSAYLKQVLVERKDGRIVDPTLQVHIWSLFLQFREMKDFFDAICTDFGEHLYRTGRLVWVMELGKRREALGTKLDNKNDLQISYGNQALILQAWGRLEEAMELLKKKETLCIEIGNKDSLQASYGSQAYILQKWGRDTDVEALLEKQRKTKEQIR